MKAELRKPSLSQVLMWIALILALAGSLRHVAYTFTSIDGGRIWGFVQAVAVDVGLFALVLGITQRRRVHRPTRLLWLGIGLFSAISVYANLAYGLTFTLDSVPDWIVHSKPWVLAATLPVLVMYLAEVAGTDVSYMIKLAEREQRKAERKLTVDTETPIDQARRVKAEQDSLQVDERRRQLVGILAEQPHIGATALAERLGVSRTTVYKDLDALADEGTISRNGQGYKVHTA